MASKIFLILCLIIAVVATGFSSCKKNKCVNDGYFFAVNAKFFPDLDSIPIGDTIYLELKEPVSLKDMNSGNIINYTGATNLGTVTGFEELIGNGNVRYAVSDFNVLLLKGREVTSVDPNRFKEYSFNEEGGFYVFKIAIIPKKAGIYRTGVSNAANVYTKTNPCDRSGFSVKLKETNQHLYYNQQNFGVVPMLPNGVYCFKVK